MALLKPMGLGTDAMTVSYFNSDICPASFSTPLHVRLYRESAN
ncbi:hypothetical protein TPR58_12105 [Sphingomonas sp. HF-S3]|uniref:Uncharacterized protein n=1 Tax=Sphingomonas rustica TaxID=3103142 RepID=A0ABV0BC15_9SPHN